MNKHTAVLALLGCCLVSSAAQPLDPRYATVRAMNNMRDTDSHRQLQKLRQRKLIDARNFREERGLLHNFRAAGDSIQKLRDADTDSHRQLQKLRQRKLIDARNF